MLGTGVHVDSFIVISFLVHILINSAVPCCSVTMPKRKCIGSHKGGKIDPCWFEQSKLHGPNSNLCMNHYKLSLEVTNSYSSFSLSFSIFVSHRIIISLLITHSFTHSFTRSFIHSFFHLFMLFLFLFFFLSFLHIACNWLLRYLAWNF